MPIYFNYAKDSSKPNTLAVKQDRVMEKDTIHLTECMWAITDTKISFIGILGSECVGVECYDDKSFKPSGQKVAFSFFKDQHEVYNKETKKYDLEATSAEQKLVFSVLTDTLNAVTATGATCANAMMKPAASGILLQLWESQDSVKRAMIPEFTKHMFVLKSCEAKELSFVDAEFVGVIAQQKPGDYKKSGGGGNYKPAETEAEKLQSRLAFLKAQMPVLQSETLLDMYLELKMVQNPDFEAAFAVVLQIIGGSK